LTLPLFGEPSGFDRVALAERLRELAGERIWIGTSSWKYEGWLGQIYTRDRYLSRGKFSQKRFAAECLSEYAETFPVVCGDFSFYQFPSPEFWQRLFTSAPAGLQIALKAPEEVTCERFPKHARYGPRAGSKNESYFNADALEALFLEPLATYAERLGPIIFEFGARTAEPIEFIDRLEAFLDALPPGFRYAVEVRNREYLAPRYFEVLRAHRIAHVLNSWTRMPGLGEQMAMVDSLPAGADSIAERADFGVAGAAAFTADFTVVRALLRPGRAYEDAVAMFTPYDEVRDENPEARESLRALIRRMREERRAAYIFVNNRLEGNAPETIRAVVDERDI
jgi:uncharacterized protein YecE (DUF72 family)